MQITQLTLNNFRNHTDTCVEWGPGINLITGPNGSGKTNLIDAIHYLCMSRSFVSASDRYVVQNGTKHFTVQGKFEGSIRSQLEIRCTWTTGAGKQIFVHESPLDRLSDLIGLVPVVVISPEDRKLTAEGPAERRAFLDSFISQFSPAYLRDLIRFKKIRKQRNSLLQQAGESSQEIPSELLRERLEPWNRLLAESGSNIIAKRAEVLDRFKGYLDEQFRSFSGLDLKPGLEYKTIGSMDSTSDPEQIGRTFDLELQENFGKEVAREQSLIGPHRDEILFRLGEMELRPYGSEGQHRLFSVALKLAQLFYYSDELDDLPIILLDDVFGNLDSQKTEILLKMLVQHPGQVFITSATESPLEYLDRSGIKEATWFSVENGTVTRRN
ncbi:MAG: DNA replication and repair protein RecF [Balneolaceae bacterium]